MGTGTAATPHRIFGAPLRYIQGPGALQQTGPMAATLGSHVLLVGDAFVLDMVGEVVQRSGQQAGVTITPVLFGGEITPAEIERLVTTARAHAAHGVMAAGGGKGIDAGKALAHHLQVPVITLPTIASNDAPTSKIYVVYDEQHRLLKVEHMAHNPHAVIVDTALIAKAPRQLLLAGIGDAISKKFEVAQCHAAQGQNIFGGLGTRAALAMADVCFDMLLQHADDVGCLGQEPPPALRRTHTALQPMRMITASIAAAGIVVSHAMPISRTISHRTWRQRRRPAPMPTTDEATTWVVLTGAPTSDAPRMTAVDDVWLVKESRGVRPKIRCPMVRTMRHPPSAVPSVSAAPVTILAHSGTVSSLVSPVASRSTAMTPIAFCASLPP